MLAHSAAAVPRGVHAPTLPKESLARQEGDLDKAVCAHAQVI